jgi:probable F420-dependent oxidoreductase
MKLKATLPFDGIEHPEEFLRPEAISEIATHLERMGFDGCAVTDHPCPTGRWLDAGGHHAQDPFVLLALIAAVTRTLRLQTHILVLPYRNPFITARAVATLDVFSGGRVSLGVGAGYLKGEYRALGVDFERRNEIMDESLRALKIAWTEDEFAFQGTGYQAPGNRILPRPVQKPHPPLVIGGNSTRAIRRAVELGDAWCPFFASGAVSTTSRTAAMEDEADLAKGIRTMRDYCEQMGRERPPELQLGGLSAPGGTWNPEALLDKIGRFAALGVTAATVHIGGRSRAEWCDNAARYQSDIISRLR